MDLTTAILTLDNVSGSTQAVVALVAIATITIVLAKILK